MFIGHIAVALGAKKAAPRTSLGTLLLAAEWPDLIWPIFLALGWERVEIDPGNGTVTPLDFLRYPLSHSLLAVGGWALLLGGIYLLWRGYGRGALWVALCVLSHWLLDAFSHNPDLPLYPHGTTYVGLGLWNSLFRTVLVEGLMFVVGVVLYTRATWPRDKIGDYAFRVFVALLAFLYLMGLLGPPPSVDAVEMAGFASWILIPWAYWIDRHRYLARLFPVRPPG